MKGKATSSFALLFVVGLILIVSASSCSKSSSTPSFIGTYYGVIGGTGGNADTIVITAGSSASSVIMLSHTSRGSVYTINGTVSGSSLTIPLQAYVYYGNNDTVQGSGGLSGSTLSINYTFSDSGHVNNYNYTGTKQ